MCVHVLLYSPWSMVKKITLATKTNLQFYTHTPFSYFTILNKSVIRDWPCAGGSYWNRIRARSLKAHKSAHIYSENVTEVSFLSEAEHPWRNEARSSFSLPMEKMFAWRCNSQSWYRLQILSVAKEGIGMLEVKDWVGWKPWCRTSGTMWFIHLLGNLENWCMFCNHHNGEEGKVHGQTTEQLAQSR